MLAADVSKPTEKRAKVYYVLNGKTLNKSMNFVAFKSKVVLASNERSADTNLKSDSNTLSNGSHDD